MWRVWKMCWTFMRNPMIPNVRWFALTRHPPSCWRRPSPLCRPSRDFRCARTTNTGGRVPATCSWPASPWRVGERWRSRSDARCKTSPAGCVLGIPVVLLYLGFLNAQDMAEPLFRSEAEWTRAIRDHCRGAVDERCWGEWLDFAGVPPERRPLEVRPVPPRNSGGPESARGWG